MRYIFVCVIAFVLGYFAQDLRMYLKYRRRIRRMRDIWRSRNDDEALNIMETSDR